ncbi:MAG: DUF3037 domain-containing protein [Jatrophihabitans sp.]|uniref:DUF3037 domain-containing protein n=1 Tax=Jatrophihabitans sp. TaxID=1932789 RepID=UPI003F7CF4E3
MAAVIDRAPFEYAVLQVVPRVDRGESMNAGVLVYSRALDFLGAAVDLDHDRLLALDPTADVAQVEAVLDAVVGLCRGEGDGPAVQEAIGARFRWLTAPRSTVVRAGPVHTGLTADPERETARLLARLVHPL